MPATTTLEPTGLANLDAALRGPLIRPDDEGYDEARRIYNAMIDKRPGAIAVCNDAADVIAAVRFAADADAPVAVRGGGHNGPGLALCDDGLVIDLSQMNAVRVDPSNRTARAQGGCTWGDVDHATHAFGLATPSGIIGTTGIAGLTLGGGHGYLTRRYGLTVDNLISADVVLANGEFVTASEDRHSDLFWALRGGGGNFGVVTSFEYRLHPVDTVHAGMTLWPMERIDDALRWYDGFLADAPRDLYGFFELLTVPPVPEMPEELHGRELCGVQWCYTGPPERAEQTFAAVRDFAEPVFEHLGPMPYPTLQSMHDELYPPGLQWYWKGEFVHELTDDAIDAHTRFANDLPSPFSTMHLYPIDGAVHDVAPDATAFRHRDARWSQVIVGVDPDPANADRITDWAKAYWEAVHAGTEAGGYVNFMMEEGEERIRATYGDNYDRLVAIKTKYDANNLFRVNQNIPPEA